MSYTMGIKVQKVTKIETFGEKQSKRQILKGIIEGEYPKTFWFEFWQDKINLLKGIKENEYYTVSFNINSRVVKNDSGSDINFVSLNAWKIE